MQGPETASTRTMSLYPIRVREAFGELKIAIYSCLTVKFSQLIAELMITKLNQELVCIKRKNNKLENIQIFFLIASNFSRQLKLFHDFQELTASRGTEYGFFRKIRSDCLI